MFDAEDEDRVSEIVKAEAVVAHTQSPLGWVHSLKLFQIAFICKEIAGQGIENSKRLGLINGAKISLGLVRP